MLAARLGVPLNARAIADGNAGRAILVLGCRAFEQRKNDPLRICSAFDRAQGRKPGHSGVASAEKQADSQA
jgi:hypothetical protein